MVEEEEEVVDWSMPHSGLETRQVLHIYQYIDTGWPYLYMFVYTHAHKYIHMQKKKITLHLLKMNVKALVLNAQFRPSYRKTKRKGQKDRGGFSFPERVVTATSPPIPE